MNVYLSKLNEKCYNNVVAIIFLFFIFCCCCYGTVTHRQKHEDRDSHGIRFSISQVLQTFGTTNRAIFVLFCRHTFEEICVYSHSKT